MFSWEFPNNWKHYKFSKESWTYMKREKENEQNNRKLQIKTYQELLIITVALYSKINYYMIWISIYIYLIYQRKLEIMGDGKLINFLLLQTLIAFWKTNWLYWSFDNQDLKWIWYIHDKHFHFSASFDKFKMTTICSNFIFQRAVKAWIIANCLDFTISVSEWMIFYHID